MAVDTQSTGTQESSDRQDPHLEEREELDGRPSIEAVGGSAPQDAAPKRRAFTPEELDKEQRKAAIFMVYREKFPATYEAMLTYIKTLEDAGPQFVLPTLVVPSSRGDNPEEKEKYDELVLSATYLHRLLTETPLVATDKKDATHLQVGTPGGFIDYSESKLHYKHPGFSLDPQKNKTLFSLSDALMMANHARHRPDMLPPNGMKLGGSRHFRALLQVAVSQINEELAPGERLHITNPLSEAELARTLGSNFIAEQAVKKFARENNPAANAPEQAQQPAAATADQTAQTTTPPDSQTETSLGSADPSSAEPASTLPPEPKMPLTAADVLPINASEQEVEQLEKETAADEPAHRDTTVTTQPSEEASATSNEELAQSASLRSGKYHFDTLDPVLQQAIFERKKSAFPDISNDEIKTRWDERPEQNRRVETGVLQASLYAKMIRESADPAKVGTLIGSTVGSDLPVYEAHIAYEGLPKEAETAVRYALEENNQPVIMRIARNDHHAGTTGRKYTLADKPKTDFEESASGDQPSLESADPSAFIGPPAPRAPENKPAQP